MAEISELDATSYEITRLEAEDCADKIRRNNALSRKEKKKLLAGNAIRFELEAK